MKLLPLIFALCLAFVAPAWAASTVVIVTLPSLGLTNVPMIMLGAERFSDYTNRPNPLSTDLVLIADPVSHTNAYVTWGQLLTAAATGGSIIANPWDTNQIPVNGVASNSVFTGITTNSTTYFTNQTSADLAGFGAGGLLESISLGSSLLLSGTTISVVGANVTGLNAGNISSGTLPYSALPGGLGLLNTNNASGLTNIPIVSSVTIPMGAWFTNNVGDGASLTAASYESVTNSGDGYGFADVVTNVIRSKFALPWDWDGAAVRVSLEALCSGTNASAGSPTNVVFAVRAAALGGGDNVSNPTWGTAIWTTNGISTNKFVKTMAITQDLTVGNSPDSTKSILWEIQRLGSQSGDSETNGTLYATEVRVFFKRKTRIDLPASTP